MRKKVFVAAGYTTTFIGPGRPEFNPKKLIPYEEYLVEVAQGVAEQLLYPEFDEGIIGSFQSSRFLNQANLPGLLPMMTKSLLNKPCTAVEGACGTGGRAIAMGTRAILSDLSNRVFVTAFEMQNSLKPVLGADALAAAGWWRGERKRGFAHFFPGIFARRAEAYFKRWGHDRAREGMAAWYRGMIENARKCPKAQEHFNDRSDLLAYGMLPPDPDRFVPFLNHADCSKVSDGASGLVLLSEEGLQACPIRHEGCVEIIGIGEAVADLTQAPDDLTLLSTTKIAVEKALAMAKISRDDLALLEIHDCFTISALLAFEALGFAKPGKGSDFILEGRALIDGKIPTNLSGGLIGFGHPTGASGVRQMVDLLHQFIGTHHHQAKLKTPYGMMVSMGGNDKTVTAIVVKRLEG